jgi:hypothetical protein
MQKQPTQYSTITYQIVDAMFDTGKFEVKVTTPGYPQASTTWMQNRLGAVRLFATRNSARKAITRARRVAAGVPGALHR